LDIYMIFLLPLLASLFLTLLFIPLAIRFAKRYRLLDNPKLRPHPAHIQDRIVPRAGGLAPYFAISICLLIFLPIQQYSIGILVALTILLLIGLADDRFQKISPYLRLIIQFLAAAAVVSSGVGIDFITNPLGGILQFVDPLQAKLLAVFWIVWVMNMLNWAKGVDGQMPGIVTISALILGFLSLKLFLAGDPNQADVAKLAFITAGASFGLLIFNWYPAKIFPGFSGSTIFGLLISTLAILSGAKLATAGLVLLIPATDFIYTVLRRVASGKSPVWGDRGHLHHKLLDKGLTHSQITLFYMLGSAMLGAAALTLNSRDKAFAAILVSACVLGIILWLNFFGALSKQSDPDNG
jgi:UDP-GlcNAc:undecaprenyl-phosphate/decaprenyl-phosphate GlcNAc-1-phosphate transferase